MMIFDGATTIAAPATGTITMPKVTITTKPTKTPGKIERKRIHIIQTFLSMNGGVEVEGYSIQHDCVDLPLMHGFDPA
ncbi:hypothetical protein, partial [Desulfosarcina cetonica]|uniref:hypothetical protein n=1 Tax=Desulfosarcina cetonica TaxID=90730 RepID=UPI001C478970